MYEENMKGEEWLKGHSSFTFTRTLARSAALPQKIRKTGEFFIMKKSIKDTVREAIEPTVCELGYRIWDVVYSKIGADYHLEITIDSDNGINIDDCERVHRAIDPILDEADPIEGFYYLEVSSPGIERELRTDEHISLSLGQRVEAKLFSALNGKKSFVGVLGGFDGKSVAITPDGEDTEILIPRESISKLNTVYF